MSLVLFAFLPANLPTENCVSVQTSDTSPIMIAVHTEIPLFINDSVAR